MGKDSNGEKQNFTLVPFKPKNGASLVKEMLEYLISISDDIQSLVICANVNDHDGGDSYLMTAWTCEDIADVALAMSKLQESIWNRNGDNE